LSGKALYGTEPKLQLNDTFKEIDDIRDFIAQEREQFNEANKTKMLVVLKIDRVTKMGVVTDVRMYTLPDLRGLITVFIDVTEGVVHDIKVPDRMPFNHGSYYVLVIGYAGQGHPFYVLINIKNKTSNLALLELLFNC